MYNNFNNNNQFGGFGYNNYNTNVKEAKMSQPLTKEQIKALRNNNTNFTLAISEEEIERGICTHKDGGKITLYENPNGTHTCSICGETFELVDRSPEEIAALTRDMLDVLQSIKTYYLDMPASAIREFFILIPLLKKVPKLYEMALNNFNDHSNINTTYNNNMYGYNALNMLTGVGAPGVPGQGGMNFNQGMNMGMGMNQGMQQQFGGCQQGNYDPFYTSQQQPMNQGMNQGMQQQPQMNQQPTQRVEQHKNYIL